MSISWAHTPEQKVALCIIAAHYLMHPVPAEAKWPQEVALAEFESLVHDADVHSWLVEHFVPTAPPERQQEAHEHLPQVLMLQMTPVQAIMLGALFPIIMEQMDLGKKKTKPSRLESIMEHLALFVPVVYEHRDEFNRLALRAMELSQGATF